jgi:hypothetical protein
MSFQQEQKENYLGGINFSSDERVRYQQLRDSLRPTSLLTIPRDSKAPINRIPTSALDSFKNSSDSADLIFMSDLRCSNMIVIPESRIKTPRTPQNPYRRTPMSSMSRSYSSDAAQPTSGGPRTKSPTDEKYFRSVLQHQTNPAELLHDKYKAKTPRASAADFVL